MYEVSDVLKVIKTLPDDGVNPGGGCKYTYGDKHCLVGEVVILLGGKVPDEADVDLNTRAFDDLIHRFDIGISFSREAILLLTEAQRAADDHPEKPWVGIKHNIITEEGQS